MNDETVEDLAAKTKYTLFTNISFIQIEKDKTPMRLDCHALLIEEGAIGMLESTQNRIRGFGPDPAWPIFKYWLPQGPVTYSLDKKEDKSAMFIGTRKNAKPRPLFSGSLLTIANGPTFFLQIEDASKPLDVFERVGDIEDVWFQLENRVARYWQAPYMPHSNYGPPWETLQRLNIQLRRKIANENRNS
jgi:hypothetical protein